VITAHAVSLVVGDLRHGQRPVYVVTQNRNLALVTHNAYTAGGSCISKADVTYASSNK